MSKNQLDNVTPLRPPTPCPQCKKPNKRAYYPFCSKRCADLDLGAWLDGKYRLTEGHQSGSPKPNGE